MPVLRCINKQTPKDLKITDLQDPNAGPDDYVIEVHAAATNFFDILQVQGKYQLQPRMSHPIPDTHRVYAHSS